MFVDLIFFELRGRRCALPVTTVREVLGVPSVTPVPQAPPSVRGLVPLHGQALPLVDLGPHLAPGGDSQASPLRAEGSRILLVETTLPEDGTLVRAALMVDRVTRLGTVAEEHARPAPPNAPFVSATVLDVEGPALLIDAAGALEAVRASLRQSVHS